MNPKGEKNRSQRSYMIHKKATWYMEVAQNSQLLNSGFMSKNFVQVLAVSLIQVVIIKTMLCKGDLSPLNRGRLLKMDEASSLPNVVCV